MKQIWNLFLVIFLIIFYYQLNLTLSVFHPLIEITLSDRLAVHFGFAG